MTIPDSPEQLFEQLTETSVHALYPNYNALKPRHRKLLNLLHCEMIKGEPGVPAIYDSLLFIAVFWDRLNEDAHMICKEQILASDEVDLKWVRQLEACAEISQFIRSLLAALGSYPPGIRRMLEKYMAAASE